MDKMDVKYWDRKSKSYNTEIFDVLKNDSSEVIQSFIKDVASKKKVVADIGCAIGKWLPLLSAKFKEVYAVDFSILCLNDAEKKYKNLKNIKFMEVDMVKGFTRKYSFDVMLCVNAILTEVYDKRKRFFKNLHSNLKKGGHLVLVVPSFESQVYSDFALDAVDRKAGVKAKKISGTVSKLKFNKLQHGIIELDNVPTKHYLKEELIFTLNELGFEVLKIDKAQYTWDTEIENPPKWLKAPFPWDWVVVAKKIR